MATFLTTPDGKRVRILDSDPCLYSAAEELHKDLRKTKPQYPTSSNLYYHQAKSGNEYFYFHDWNMGQESPHTNRLCTKEEAEEFLREKLCYDNCSVMEDTEAEKLEENYGFDLIQETA